MQVKIKITHPDKVEFDEGLKEGSELIGIIDEEGDFISQSPNILGHILFEHQFDIIEHIPEVDDLVLVRQNGDIAWQARYFCKKENGIIYCFPHGLKHAATREIMQYDQIQLIGLIND